MSERRREIYLGCLNGKSVDREREEYYLGPLSMEYICKIFFFRTYIQISSQVL